MNLKQSFGRKLQEIRIARGLTQEQLAEQINKSLGTIAKIESGSRYPKPETLEALKKVLKCSYKDFYDFEETSKFSVNNNMLYELNNLNNAGKNLLLQISKRVLKEMKEYKK